jgi:hypothetical protein
MNQRNSINKDKNLLLELKIENNILWIIKI